jgi:thiol-disulfide isomerase/thioredoxin
MPFSTTCRTVPRATIRGARAVLGHVGRAVVLAPALAAFVLIAGTSAVSAAQPGRGMPDRHRLVSDADQFASLVLEDLRGNKVRLADWSGKVVLLSFWATWCRPCVDELPDLGRLAAKYRDRGFVILAASLDEGQGRALAREMAGKLPEGIEVVFGATTDDLLRYDLGDSVPVSLLFGRDGTIADRRRGTIDPGTLDDKIERLLGTAPTEKKRFPGAIQANAKPARGTKPPGLSTVAIVEAFARR